MVYRGGDDGRQGLTLWHGRTSTVVSGLLGTRLAIPELSRQ